MGLLSSFLNLCVCFVSTNNIIKMRSTVFLMCMMVIVATALPEDEDSVADNMEHSVDKRDVDEELHDNVEERDADDAEAVEADEEDEDDDDDDDDDEDEEDEDDDDDEEEDDD